MSLPFCSDEVELLKELEEIIYKFASDLGEVPFRGRLILDELTALRQDDRDLMFISVTTGQEKL